jgi:hypothetical protein
MQVRSVCRPKVNGKCQHCNMLRAQDTGGTWSLLAMELYPQTMTLGFRSGQ